MGSRTSELVLGIILLAFLLFSGCTNVTVDLSLVEKEPIDLLPIWEEVDTIWTRDYRSNLTIDEEIPGFISSAELSMYILESSYGSDVSQSYVQIYKFDTIANAEVYYNKQINDRIQEGGYKELDLDINADCWAARTGSYSDYYSQFAWCQKKNIVFVTEVMTRHIGKLNYYETLAKMTANKI